MDKVEQLTQLLTRLNAGEDPESVKQEAKEFLATIGPKDLSLAEQKLMEAGLSVADLRHLCSVHMEMLGGELEKMRANLKPGHVIHTFVSEHDMILGFLDDLEKTNQAVQNMTGYDAGKEEFKTLNHIADHLVGAEPHHKREEDVLFPEVEKRGVYGPTQIMRKEHEDLRKYKGQLKELSDTVDKTDFSDFKKRLAAVSDTIVATLRDHIFKENNILYPTALQVISEEQTWQDMKAACDKIGYCCFTPQV